MIPTQFATVTPVPPTVTSALLVPVARVAQWIEQRSSDGQGAAPAGDPILPEQVAASFYHSLGIDHRKEYQTDIGRPVMIVRDGALIPGLWG